MKVLHSAGSGEKLYFYTSQTHETVTSLHRFQVLLRYHLVLVIETLTNLNHRAGRSEITLTINLFYCLAVRIWCDFE